MNPNSNLSEAELMLEIERMAPDARERVMGWANARFRTAQAAPVVPAPLAIAPQPGKPAGVVVRPWRPEPVMGPDWTFFPSHTTAIIHGFDPTPLWFDPAHLTTFTATGMTVDIPHYPLPSTFS